MVHHFLKTYIISPSFHSTSSSILKNKLTMVCDNCSGQNKNNTLICLANWLTEAGYFGEVAVSFLIKGHMKNLCDHLFNLLKTDYYHLNLYTKETTITQLNNSPYITMVNVTPNFFDYNSYFDTFYK